MKRYAEVFGVEVTGSLLALVFGLSFIGYFYGIEDFSSY